MVARFFNPKNKHMTIINLNDEQIDVILFSLCLLSQRAKGTQAQLASDTYDAILEQSPMTSEGFDR